MPRAPVAPYAPCPHCGRAVLRGQTPSGQPVTVEPAVQTYVVVWQASTAPPVLHPSRGSPVHQCTPAVQHVP
jgi:hypothetical protein